MLLDDYDALLVDLDGTLLLAGTVIPHAAEAMAAAQRDGVHVLIVTNNASRSPRHVSERLAKRGIDVDADHVATSPQAAASLLAASHRPEDPVLIVGAPALEQEVALVGLRPTRKAADQPVAVVQGFSPDIGWTHLAEACIALRAGADWVATNDDSTLPTDRGLLPGNGSLVAALVAATGLKPRVAGKPQRPLMDEAARRVGSRRPLVVGDRLGTDIAAARAAHMDSMMVLTGVSTIDDVIATPQSGRPTYLAADLRALSGQSPVIRVADFAAGTGDEELRSAASRLP